MLVLWSDKAPFRKLFKASAIFYVCSGTINNIFVRYSFFCAIYVKCHIFITNAAHSCYYTMI